jgi:hypothetical protein
MFYASWRDEISQAGKMGTPSSQEDTMVLLCVRIGSGGGRMLHFQGFFLEVGAMRGWRSADGIRSDRGLSGAKIVKETRNNFLLPAAT